MKGKFTSTDMNEMAYQESQSLKKELSEKNILLSLTKNIGQSKAKNELMHLIKERFQDLFHFYRLVRSALFAMIKKHLKYFFLTLNQN